MTAKVASDLDEGFMLGARICFGWLGLLEGGKGQEENYCLLTGLMTTGGGGVMTLLEPPGRGR